MLNVDLQMALLVMGIGMITVFAILTLVVISGQLLIRIVNHYNPPPAVLPTPKPVPLQQNDISPATIAVLTATVEAFTAGRGTIMAIEPLDASIK